MILLSTGLSLATIIFVNILYMVLYKLISLYWLIVSGHFIFGIKQIKVWLRLGGIHSVLKISWIRVLIVGRVFWRYFWKKNGWNPSGLGALYGLNLFYRIYDFLRRIRMVPWNLFFITYLEVMTVNPLRGVIRWIVSLIDVPKMLENVNFDCFMIM